MPLMAYTLIPYSTLGQNMIFKLPVNLTVIPSARGQEHVWALSLLRKALCKHELDV